MAITYNNIFKIYTLDENVIFFNKNIAADTIVTLQFDSYSYDETGQLSGIISTNIQSAFVPIYGSAKLFVDDNGYVSMTASVSYNLYRVQTSVNYNPEYKKLLGFALEPNGEIVFGPGTDFTHTTVASASELIFYPIFEQPQPTHITLDLSTIGLPEGTHSIQMKLSDDGVTKADSELSNAVSYTVGGTWEYPVEDGDNLIITQAHTITEDGDYLIIE